MQQTSQNDHPGNEIVAQYFATAQMRLQNRQRHESFEVTQSAVLDVLEFTESKAMELGVPLPPEFDTFKKEVKDIKNVRAIVARKGESMSA